MIVVGQTPGFMTRFSSGPLTMLKYKLGFLLRTTSDIASQVADEEALPFKTLHCLAYELGLRVVASPESTHSVWNDCRNSVRRAGLQHCMLLASTLANVLHGPFKGGKNFQSFGEAAEDLARTITPDQFADLQDQMCADLRVDPNESELIPESASAIPDLQCVKNLPPFVPR